MRILILDDNPDDRELVKREIRALFPNAAFVEDGTDWKSFDTSTMNVEFSAATYIVSPEREKCAS